MKRRTFIQGTAALATTTSAYLLTSQALKHPEAVPFVLMGGFLGAGKSTFLWESSKRLQAMGYSVGFITNDQASNVVDTVVLQDRDASVAEVSDGCFCCNFHALEDAIQFLRNRGASIILAEAVGSCADLSATVAQPMKRLLPELNVRPITVMATPQRILEAYAHADTNLLSNVLYIIRKQLEEADLIVLNSHTPQHPRDSVTAKQLLAEFLPSIPVLDCSATSTTGLDSWLEYLFSDTVGGQRITTMDYDRYADGEAALGWLNAIVTLKAEDSGALAFTKRFFDSIQTHSNDLEIGHIKTTLNTAQGLLLGNHTHRNMAASIRTSHSGNVLPEMHATINARVQTTPEHLEALITQALHDAQSDSVHPHILSLQRFAPPRPVPTYRFTTVV